MRSKKDAFKKKISKDSDYKLVKNSLKYYLDFALLSDNEIRAKNTRGIKEMVLKNALNAIVLNG